MGYLLESRIGQELRDFQKMVSYAFFWNKTGILM